MEDTNVILYDKREGIALISFNRPEALNALNTRVNLTLVEMLDRAERDDEVKVVVLTGTGTKAFVAGADIKEMENLDAMGAREFALNAKRDGDKIYQLNKPII
ncbi:MAG: enoyl-CoA hydratase/isomerase family protein, partial [Syntrophales bacterium]|nr:enoyl-CoA hydratase/isomerase family protein [Syntrophales bacterium]